MSRVVCDARIASIENLDRARSVLMDSHSLRTLNREFLDAGVPQVITNRDFVAKPGGCWLAHIIQSFVLYEKIVIDSALFEIDSAVQHAFKLFPDAVTPLFLRDSTLERVGLRVEAADPKISDRPISIPEDVWFRWMQLDSSEKPLMDRLDDSPPRLVPPEYAEDEEVAQKLKRNKPIWGLPRCCTNSMMTVARAHFYLELARDLMIPLNIDPVRTTYLLSVVEGYETNVGYKVAAQVVNTFTRLISSEDNLLDFDLEMPPVPECVLRYAQMRSISLYEATQIVRGSRNARAFRNLCADLFRFREDGSLQARKEVARITDELKRVCKMWTADEGDGVEYYARKIRIGEIPLVGQVFKVVGMDEVTVPDPIIVPDKRYRYFLFLNDLLRKPHPFSFS